MNATATLPTLSDPDEKQAMLARLARVEGQVRAVQRMIEEGTGCDEVAHQLSAARKALDKAFFEMLACMVRASAEAPPGARVPTSEKVAALLARYA